MDGLLDTNPDVERGVDLAEDLPDSARAGTRLGEVAGKEVGETGLVAKKGYDEASSGQRVWYTVEGLFD